jgi:hypothetical protein
MGKEDVKLAQRMLRVAARFDAMAAELSARPDADRPHIQRACESTRSMADALRDAAADRLAKANIR